MLRYPLDERFHQYGYEDVLWGKTLKENNITILHIDNALGYQNFIGNWAFIRKTEESLHTLYQFRKELEGYSKIITYAKKNRAISSQSFMPKTVSIIKFTNKS